MKKVKVDKCREVGVGEWVKSSGFRSGVDRFDERMSIKNE